MASSDLIGTRIRTYRERLGMSIDDLAKNTGIDAGIMARIEQGGTCPPIGTMVKIARALGQRLGTFMDDQTVDEPLIVRSCEMTEESSSLSNETSEHYHYFPLSKGKPDRHMEPFFIVVDPTADRTLTSHEGEEFVIVMAGEVELIYGKERFRLKAGDSMYYNSVVPHFLGAAGEDKAEIYAVIYMPF